MSNVERETGQNTWKGTDLERLIELRWSFQDLYLLRLHLKSWRYPVQICVYCSEH